MPKPLKIGDKVRLKKKVVRAYSFFHNYDKAVGTVTRLDFDYPSHPYFVDFDDGPTWVTPTWVGRHEVKKVKK